jgi:hypothetical protein
VNWIAQFGDRRRDSVPKNAKLPLQLKREFGTYQRCGAPTKSWLCGNFGNLGCLTRLPEML